MNKLFARFFLVVAMVLIVFAMLATTATSLTFLSWSWTSWLCAALLSWMVDRALDAVISS